MHQVHLWLNINTKQTQKIQFHPDYLNYRLDREKDEVKITYS